MQITNKINYQAGDVHIIHGYYKNVLSFMPKIPQECLNVGSGIAFEFEKYINEHRNFIDKIDCMDQFVSEFINNANNDKGICNIIKQNIEIPFKLEKEYDIVFSFEVIEHVNETDVLLENCYNHIKKDGLFMIAVPNLSSLYARFELLLGFQPHILEVSNKLANFGTGLFGKLNNPKNEPIHHIRGFTYRAIKEMLKYNNFKIIKSIGYNKKPKLPLPVGLSSVVLFICKKI
jgi:2-polyprenyl-3-methyl-5-hydroxy-6-metoxy-1,4-benzoquinol methylase